MAQNSEEGWTERASRGGEAQAGPMRGIRTVPASEAAGKRSPKTMMPRTRAARPAFGQPSPALMPSLSSSPGRSRYGWSGRPPRTTRRQGTEAPTSDSCRMRVSVGVAAPAQEQPWLSLAWTPGPSPLASISLVNLGLREPPLRQQSCESQPRDGPLGLGSDRVPASDSFKPRVQQHNHFVVRVVLAKVPSCFIITLYLDIFLSFLLLASSQRSWNRGLFSTVNTLCHLCTHTPHSGRRVSLHLHLCPPHTFPGPQVSSCRPGPSQGEWALKEPQGHVWGS